LLPGPITEKAGCATISYVFPADPAGKPDLIQVKKQVGAVAPEWIRFIEKSPGWFLPVKK
jgi:hypothetical protein